MWDIKEYFAGRLLEHRDVVYCLPSLRRLILHQKEHDFILAIHVTMKELISFGLALSAAEALVGCWLCMLYPPST